MEEKCFYFTSEKLCYHDVSETIQVIMDCRLQSEASKKCFQGATQFWSSNVGMMRFQGNSQMCKKVILSCVPANSGRWLCMVLISLQPPEVETMREEKISLVKMEMGSPGNRLIRKNNNNEKEKLCPQLDNNTLPVPCIFRVFNPSGTAAWNCYALFIYVMLCYVHTCAKLHHILWFWSHTGTPSAAEVKKLSS